MDGFTRTLRIVRINGQGERIGTSDPLVPNPILHLIEFCSSQLVLIESVARPLLNLDEVCCFWVLSPPQDRLQWRTSSAVGQFASITFEITPANVLIQAHYIARHKVPLSHFYDRSPLSLLTACCSGGQFCTQFGISPVVGMWAERL